MTALAEARAARRVIVGLAERQRLRALRRQGMTILEIMRATGRSENTVQRHTRGVAVRTTPEKRQALLRMDEAGTQRTFLARSLGSSRASLSVILCRARRERAHA